jgi:hypothetical protein
MLLLFHPWFTKQHANKKNSLQKVIKRSNPQSQLFQHDHWNRTCDPLVKNPTDRARHLGEIPPVPLRLHSKSRIGKSFPTISSVHGCTLAKCSRLSVLVHCDIDVPYKFNKDRSPGDQDRVVRLTMRASPRLQWVASDEAFRVAYEGSLFVEWFGSPARFSCDGFISVELMLLKEGIWTYMDQGIIGFWIFFTGNLFSKSVVFDLKIWFSKSG